MAENPLLPHRRLQVLYALMLRCRKLDRKRRGVSGIAREALLAAIASQMEPGDILCGEAGDTTVEALLPQPKTAKSKPLPRSDVNFPAPSQLLLNAGMARALQVAGSSGVVLALVSAGSSDVAWQNAFSYAQTARLPMVFVCVDTGSSSRAQTSTTALTWPTAAKLSKRTHLPIISVDGEDAVAVYRVMQESVLRARQGDGPTIAWCVLEKQRPSARSASKPIAHMKKYLEARGLKPPSRTP